MRSLISQISIHKLEVFCLVVELGSFSRAAERLGIAQPVVSAHIKALSEKFGASLVARTGRKVTLTEEGVRVYNWAREMVSRTREMEREMADFQRGFFGKATVGASMTIGSYVLPGLIAHFHTIYPKGEISVRIATPGSVTDAVHIGDCDFAFTILDPRHETTGLEIEKIMDERLILVASDSSGIVGDSLDQTALADVPFITAQSGTPRREIEEHCLAAYGVQRNRIAMEFGHAESIKQAVRAGAGAAFLFRSSVRDELASGKLRILSTPGMELQVPVYLVRRRGKQLSHFQLSLMDALSRGLNGQEPERNALAMEGA
ncbi:putative transcriptional regulator, LysR family [Pseudorhizobium banfieldiae]|uniref:HTH-type transcriptional regulator TtuA n=1 Tax=Pseudorhizobium banfieldiae TaxID=1125847 RepID=L0NB71_9HYPH|nr:LysR family transcriptional regulator [Pseudorhizobium banfieldiae]CAD6602012.1 LysR family transcriptional regulator [arsenite-oxidising bacterium NT-25]CAD6606426.1 LysR family transcriptional regulator [Rhizobium sp. TCK]CCF18343.1 putative transcriptional regulator, LysR family [Pseudorhizobium banfieldiae]